MLTFFYRKLASNLVMLIARHLLFYGLHNTEKVMNEIIRLSTSRDQNFYSRQPKFRLIYVYLFYRRLMHFSGLTVHHYEHIVIC